MPVSNSRVAILRGPVPLGPEDPRERPGTSSDPFLSPHPGKPYQRHQIPAKPGCNYLFLRLISPFFSFKGRLIGGDLGEGESGGILEVDGGRRRSRRSRGSFSPTSAAGDTNSEGSGRRGGAHRRDPLVPRDYTEMVLPPLRAATLLTNSNFFIRFFARSL